MRRVQMKSETQNQYTEPNNYTEPANDSKKIKHKKNDRFNWWQSIIVLVLTLGICLTAGYYISSKYIWKDQSALQISERIKYYTQQVEEKPNDPKIRVQLGYTYYLKGDDDNAIKQYQVAKNLDKNNFDAYLNLSIIYDKENRSNEALEMATKAVKISPQDYKGFVMQGRSYRKLKMYDKAVASLQSARKLEPANCDVIYEIGSVAEARGDKKGAESIFKEALSYDPTYKPALTALDKLSSKK